MFETLQLFILHMTIPMLSRAWIYDKLLLFLLRSRGIDYEIKSEYKIDKAKLEEKGYSILCR